MPENRSDALIANSKLTNVLAALRDCGKTTVPMGLALQMVDKQKTVESCIESMNNVNNTIIERHGDLNDAGQYCVSPQNSGWMGYVKEYSELLQIKVDLGEPFVLYQKQDGDNMVLGWTEDVKTPVTLTPNIMADMDELLVVTKAAEEKDNVQLAGNIE